MQKFVEHETFKVIGTYVVIILALVRFMVYPLHDAVAKKKIISDELYETYQLKTQLSAKQGLYQDKPVNIRIDKGLVVPSLYEKGTSFSSMQADVLENIIRTAEKKGLAVQNFEMQEPTAGKIISDVPVLIRLTGKPDDQINLLKSVMSDRRLLLIKSMEMSKSGKDIFLTMIITAFRMEK